MGKENEEDKFVDFMLVSFEFLLWKQRKNDGFKIGKE